MTSTSDLASPAARASERSDRIPDIIGEIKDRYASLRPAEQSVADAVLADVQEAVRASNGEIADRAGVSQPTVTRFCRSIGCAGVRDFKLQLAQSLAVGETFLAIDTPETPAGELPPFWHSVLGEARGAIREVERQVNPDDVLAAAEMLAGAGRVATFGVGGSSSTLAIEAQVRLFRYGLAVDCSLEPYMARMTAATLRPGNVLLAFSATGRTPEVVEAIEIANHYGAGTIAITRPGSPVADAASVALTVAVGEYPDALTPTASRFAFLAILDVISAATGYRLGPRARESLRRIKFNILPTRPGSGLEPLGD
ncbi:MurR/RpiR family transcriptional regulator [Psychromarinibacter halotolerans]|uniref:MurR/RpiR family transcriptional regulator n=1 Tax=Psychromarinibacter halotolerans TaxID=1775175 RepID=A0ABV7GRL8_9RHOB|nr:MurR/RpiR family transcriptional regulator [Psychromarinibacter halotolerans]MDF0595338.1 MurR/RpiR family transcriptional regulator [Psychromarinibacter halotolerans]